MSGARAYLAIRAEGCQSLRGDAQLPSLSSSGKNRWASGGAVYSQGTGSLSQNKQGGPRKLSPVGSRRCSRFRPIRVTSPLQSDWFDPRLSIDFTNRLSP
jgi:predicted outer membrane repeat protein